MVADRVVLPHEEGVHHGQPQPPIAGYARNIGPIDGSHVGRVERQLSLRCQFEVAPAERPQHFLYSRGCSRIPERHPTSGSRCCDKSVGLRRWSGLRGSCGSASGCWGHGSSESRSISHGSSTSFSPWLIQSWTSNWIQAAASKFSVVAGYELLAGQQVAAHGPRVGCTDVLAVGVVDRYVPSKTSPDGAHLRMDRVGARPLRRPDQRAGPDGGSSGPQPTDFPPGSKRLCRRSVIRNPVRVASANGFGRWSQPNLRSRAPVSRMKPFLSYSVMHRRPLFGIGRSRAEPRKFWPARRRALCGCEVQYVFF